MVRAALTLVLRDRYGDALVSARSLALVFATALAVRLVVFFELRDSVLLEVLLGDSMGYVDWARGIAAGTWRGNEVFYQAPLSPYFIAVVFAVSDGSLMAVRVLQLLLGSAACVLIALATARFFARTDFAKPAAAVAGLLLALYPASTSRPLAARHCKRAAPTSRVAELQPVDLLPSHEWAT